MPYQPEIISETAPLHPKNQTTFAFGLRRYSWFGCSGGIVTFAVKIDNKFKIVCLKLIKIKCEAYFEYQNYYINESLKFEFYICFHRNLALTWRGLGLVLPGL